MYVCMYVYCIIVEFNVRIVKSKPKNRVIVIYDISEMWTANFQLNLKWNKILV